MKRKSYRPYLLLALLLFGCLNLPAAFVETFRTGMTSFSSPAWKQLSLVRMSVVPTPSISLRPQKHLEEELEKLTAEKGELLRQNMRLKKRLDVEEPSSVFAQVVYRQPSSWSSAIWIDVGEKDSPSVKVNSPVLSGNTLIGIVELVGKRQSRVRLITDSSLVVSVRAIRGCEQKREMIGLIDQLSLELSRNGDKILSSEEEKGLFEKLGILKQKLEGEAETQYLAKGEIFGTSSPLWRCRSSVLKGVGFNYDFEDEKGPARELRTGKPYGHLFQSTEVNLIQEGDLLVTTGMDGLFPAGIPVAIVSKVKPLKEGAASFSIEADLCCRKINDLSTVMVLPSLGVELEEEL